MIHLALPGTCPQRYDARKARAACPSGRTARLGRVPTREQRREVSMGSRSALIPQRVEDQDFLDRLVAEQLGRPGALLTVLERAQERHRNKYLPVETLEYVAARMGVPQARVFGVATFYAFFNLEPQGTHTVAICRGTACHTRGSRALLERVKLELSLQEPAGGADKLTLT